METTHPTGLILDFGGVIVQSESNDSWAESVADLMEEIIGVGTVPRKRIIDNVQTGETAAKLWRDAMSRPRFPKELDHETYVTDFIAADWPEDLRDQLASHASRICYAVSHHRENRTLRNGITELLSWCREQSIPLSIASNALSGQVHRDFLAQHDLGRFFVAEIYSDEAGVRKPNPELIWKAADAINVPVEQCWYVGDRIERDVLCGERAGVGATVLTPAPSAPMRPFRIHSEPDHTFPDPLGLLHHLQRIFP